MPRNCGTIEKQFQKLVPQRWPELKGQQGEWGGRIKEQGVIPGGSGTSRRGSSEVASAGKLERTRGVGSLGAHQQMAQSWEQEHS